MSLTNNDDFKRGGYDVISCHSPLVLDVEVGNNSSTPLSSGDVTVEITAQSPAENTDTYAFNMGYIETIETTPGFAWTHYFKLNITEIIKKLCREPFLTDETSSYYKHGARLATEIEIVIKRSGETSVSFTNYYMHGFNQVNDPDSSCLRDFADLSVEAVIPIVAGAPNMFWLWVTVDDSGWLYSGRLWFDPSAIHTFSLGSSITKGLYQLNHPTIFNELIHAEWNGVPIEYLSEVYSSEDSQRAGLTAVMLTEACEGSVLLAWLNRYGTYSFMAFDRFPVLKTESSHIGSFDIEVNDLADVQSRQLSRGYKDVRTVISAIAKNIPREYLSAIEDLFYSMDVYYFTGTLPEYVFDSTEWVRVTVKGDIQQRTKHYHENVRVDVMLPEKYTQVR